MFTTKGKSQIISSPTIKGSSYVITFRNPKEIPKEQKTIQSPALS